MIDIVLVTWRSVQSKALLGWIVPNRFFCLNVILLYGLLICFIVTDDLMNSAKKSGDLCHKTGANN